MIAGNHDFLAEKQPSRFRGIMKACGFTYLEDSSCEIDGVKFYGSPWTPWFGGWAFNLRRGSQAIRAMWDAIPGDTDVLVTHGPPKGVLDSNGLEECGCDDLGKVSGGIPLHLFGHIHEGHGYQYRGQHQQLAVNCAVAYGARNASVIDFVEKKAFMVKQ